jgi:hypothetical protein
MHPIKFNLKLEATYNQPHVDNSSQNRSFKTSAQAIFMDSDINVLIEQAFTTLLSEEEDYAAKGSGYSLESIDGLLLSVYKYAPIGNTPNIQLPTVNFDLHNDKENDNNNNLNQQNNINNPQNFNEQNDYRTDGFNAVAGSSYIQLPPHINN